MFAIVIGSGSSSDLAMSIFRLLNWYLWMAGSFMAAPEPESPGTV
jgi:hypothetical protein